jgi:glycosyltransferase involved in cell wall biosynthesis
MALGKPVIANDNGGNPELIVEGKNGFLIDSKDYKTLSSKLLLLLNDDGLRKRFGLKSYEIVRDKFSIQKMINSFCEKFEVYKK